MSTFRLRTYENSPPGSYPYVQPEPKSRNFRAQPMIEATAKEVAAYRAANGLARATYPEALVDVDHYQCSRLGNHPRYCIECEGTSQAIALAANAPGLAGPCKGCGAPVPQ